MHELLVIQRKKLYDHMLDVAKKYPRFSAKICNQNKLQINGVKVVTNIVNSQYVEVYVIADGETVFRIRHFDSYISTVNMVLNFINLNF